MHLHHANVLQLEDSSVKRIKAHINSCFTCSLLPYLHIHKSLAGARRVALKACKVSARTTGVGAAYFHFNLQQSSVGYFIGFSNGDNTGAE